VRSASLWRRGRQTYTTHEACVPACVVLVCAQAEISAAAEKGEVLVSVSQDVRLDNRVLDLRTPASQAIFKLQHGVCQVRHDTAPPPAGRGQVCRMLGSDLTAAGLMGQWWFAAVAAYELQDCADITCN
jgi:hypothetical protein